MSENCALCGKSVNPHDLHAWKEVIGWVGGPRKDSMRLREDTGKFAHDHCVAKLQSGQAVDQPNIFEDIENLAIIDNKTGRMNYEVELPEELQ